MFQLHLLPRPSPDGDVPRDAAPKVYQVRTPCYPTVSLLCDLSDVRRQLEETTFSFHFINAFEEDGHVIVDATHYPTYPFGRTADQKPSGFELYEPDIGMGPRSLNHLECLSCRYDFLLRLRRTTLSPDGGVETREMTAYEMEFASVNPHNVGRRQRYTVASSTFEQDDPPMCKSRLGAAGGSQTE